MKKSIFITVLGVASVVSSYSQGILFNNYVTSTQLTGVTFASGPLAGKGVGSEFQAILLYGASGSALGSLVSIGNPVSFVTSLGYPAFPSGSNIGAGDGSGWFGNAQVNFPAYNTTYAMAIEVIGTYLGVQYTGFSSVVNVTTPASAAVGSQNLPPSLRSTSFTVASSVPEPTTLALAGLGGLASLVMLRRKKA